MITPNASKSRSPKPKPRPGGAFSCPPRPALYNTRVHARTQVEATGKNAEEYLRAVSMLSGRTPDDAESDEDTIWHYYNA